MTGATTKRAWHGDLRPKTPELAVTSNGEMNKWQRFIDILMEWRRDPNQVQDAGIDPPSLETIGQAIVMAKRLRDSGLPAPTQIVPDPNRGIVFERHDNDVSEEYHFWDDGVVEYMLFQGSKLVERHKI